MVLLCFPICGGWSGERPEEVQTEQARLEQAQLEQAQPEQARLDRVRVIFLGDIMAHKEQLQGAGESWDFAPQFRRVKPLFGGALVVGNLETVFAGEKKGFSGYPSFNTPDELADALADLGVNVVTLANNHILDRGSFGALRTMEVLDRAGIFHVGLVAGGDSDEVLTLEYGGVRWSFVNYSYGSNREPEDVRPNILSDAAVTEGLRRARLSSPDILVACFHWGNEYQFTPTRRQREIAALSLSMGANLVIGTHPHVLQPIEIVKENSNQNSGNLDRGYGLVAYSLGNFVSYQRTLPRERSVILAVDVEKVETGARISRVSVAPTRVSATKPQGRHSIQVVYAGKSERFNHAGLTEGELKTAQLVGQAVLDFLGAAESPDKEGFYTLWDAASPDVLPESRRKTPQ
ncbi:MAG: CapA family protein [Synergistaceae bacterium]|nr:CapA family protein [Synergistaceae bacterium]